MYIGSTDNRGLHHLVNELVANSIDEAMAGFCNRIEVTLHADGSASVADNGRGIPVDIMKEQGKPALEVVMTKLHAGGKFGGGGYKVSGGLHGVGLSVVNALSERLHVTVMRHGKQHDQDYRRGVPVANLKVTGKADTTGTYIRFWPDPEIFEELGFNWDIVSHRLRELAFLNKALTIVLRDERIDLEYTFILRGWHQCLREISQSRQGLGSTSGRYTPSVRSTATRWSSPCSTTSHSRRTCWPSPTTSIRLKAAAMSPGSGRRSPRC